MSQATSRWVMDQCEERQKSGSMMEAAIVMAVSGDDADLVKRRWVGNMALWCWWGAKGNRPIF